MRKLSNDPPLTRSGHRLTPTSRALALKAALKACLGHVDSLVREAARFEPATTDKAFRLIGTDYDNAVIAPRLTAEMTARAPDARLALLAFSPPDVWRTLKRDEADAAPVIGMTLPEARPRTGLTKDSRVIQRKGHPNGRGPLTLGAFCAAPHLRVSPEGGGFVGAADKVLAKLGRSRWVTCSLPSFLLALGWPPARTCLPAAESPGSTPCRPDQQSGAAVPFAELHPPVRLASETPQQPGA